MAGAAGIDDCNEENLKTLNRFFGVDHLYEVNDDVPLDFPVCEFYIIYDLHIKSFIL